jgi:hypothetical protein
MLWIDLETYFGPDRRHAHDGLRILERRRANRAGSPPPLATALRQLRLRVLDARGPGVSAFVNRVHGTAALADLQAESEAAHELNRLSVTLDRTSLDDVRQHIYASLDRAHAVLRAA